MEPFIELLLQNLALGLALFVVLWLFNLLTRDPSFVDSFWGLGMVMIAWSSWSFVGFTGQHGAWLTLLCTVWGVRLGVYLLWRWRAHGPDRRYQTMMAHAKSDNGWSYGFASFVLVFALQAPLQWLVTLPVQLGVLGDPNDLTPIGWSGVALAIFGIGFETIGDLQLVAFKRRPENKGKVLMSGLWRYTRHPNYFGDACTWWGLWLIAFDAGLGQWSMPGPILLTVLLTRFSGVPTVEGRMKRTRPEYAAYVRRTSGFLPMPPRKD